MKITVLRPQSFEVKTIAVNVKVRYWEDAIINGVPDESDDEDLTPFAESDYWKPQIDLESGKIIGWPQGTKAEIHFKVCDGCEFKLLDENDEVAFFYSGYVPDLLCPEEVGGDYLIMNIDESGQINKWNPNAIQEIDFSLSV